MTAGGGELERRKIPRSKRGRAGADIGVPKSGEVHEKLEKRSRDAATILFGRGRLRGSLTANSARDPPVEFLKLAPRKRLDRRLERDEVGSILFQFPPGVNREDPSGHFFDDLIQRLECLATVGPLALGHRIETFTGVEAQTKRSDTRIDLLIHPVASIAPKIHGVADGDRQAPFDRGSGIRVEGGIEPRYGDDEPARHGETLNSQKRFRRLGPKPPGEDEGDEPGEDGARGTFPANGHRGGRIHAAFPGGDADREQRGRGCSRAPFTGNLSRGFRPDAILSLRTLAPLTNRNEAGAALRHEDLDDQGTHSRNRG